MRSSRLESEGVISLELEAADGGELPDWEPGAHVDLHLPSGLVRQYSLSGNPADRYRYRIAVLREIAGRGGSEEVHSSSLVGKIVTLTGPRNHFRLIAAARYIFIAGGIGITPILPMLRHVSEHGSLWELHYGGRSRSSLAFLDEIEALGQRRSRIIPQDELGHPDLEAILPEGLGEDVAVYCCGPAALIEAVEKRCAVIDHALSLHVERFGRDPSEEAPTLAKGFDIVLAQAGVTLHVPPDRSILDVAREIVPDLLSSCEEGVCGTCETDVLEGTPEHHDLILTPQERASGKTMMICVGRCIGDRLVLDI